MRTWRAQTTLSAPPGEVLELLTAPDALSRWSPVGFEVEDLDGDRLRTGSRARISGRLGGQRLEFDVDVFQADPERLLLRAEGPVGMDVEYTISPSCGGSMVEASITVQGRRGLTREMICRAVHVVLAVGGLEVALARLVREVECRAGRTGRSRQPAMAASRPSPGREAGS
jgi:uncharacterized protein YndB with AHSA1/START domain